MAVLKSEIRPLVDINDSSVVITLHDFYNKGPLNDVSKPPVDVTKAVMQVAMNRRGI